MDYIHTPGTSFSKVEMDRNIRAGSGTNRSIEGQGEGKRMQNLLLNMFCKIFLAMQF